MDISHNRSKSLSVDTQYDGVLTRKDFISGLEKLGIKKADKIIVHSSMSSLGPVDGGAAAVCRALMDMVGHEGIVMMPAFNQGKLAKEGWAFSVEKTPSLNGIITETFRKMDGVCRSQHPTHSFCAWGKDADSYTYRHSETLTMGEGSPLQLLEKAEGKAVLIDCLHANTFHHVVETSLDVPCLGKRTEKYPVELADGSIVDGFSWGWRQKNCPIDDDIPVYWPEMRKRGFLKEGLIGTAHVAVFNLKDCRKVVEDYLRGKIEGCEGCTTCKIRPRKLA